MASEIGALSHIFRDIDVLVLSARRPSLAAPPRGPQVCRTFIGTIPDHLHIFSRNLVLTFFRCHRSKYWLPTSAGPLCGLVAVPFVLLVVRSGPAPYGIISTVIGVDALRPYLSLDLDLLDRGRGGRDTRGGGGC